MKGVKTGATMSYCIRNEYKLHCQCYLQSRMAQSLVIMSIQLSHSEGVQQASPCGQGPVEALEVGSGWQGPVTADSEVKGGPRSLRWVSTEERCSKVRRQRGLIVGHEATDGALSVNVAVQRKTP